VAADFRILKRVGLAAIPEIVAADPTHERELSARYLTEYIRFDLGAREQQAIARFAALLVQHRFLIAAPDVARACR
jgi:predicted solute-binding protein